MRITVDMVMGERPCSGYPLERVEALWAGREWLSEHGVAKLDIPLGDIAWLLSRLLGPRDVTREVARRIARDALGTRTIPPAYLAWLDTGEEVLRPAARNAARNAARAAALDPRDAAWAAARDAARDTARDAAWAAAIEAAWEAAWAASMDTARDAAWKKYIGWMAEWLDSHGEESL